MTAAASGRVREPSPRQRQILALLAEGMTAHEIAGRLHLSYFTVRTHITCLREVLGARNRVHAVAIGYRTGLLPCGHGEDAE